MPRPIVYSQRESVTVTWQRHPRPMCVNLANLLQQAAKACPGQVALIDDQRRLTYGELEQRVRCLAGALIDGGLRREQKVAIMVPNTIAFTVAYYGTLYAGGTVVALGTLLTGDEVSKQIEHSEATVLVLGRECLPAGLPAYRTVSRCRRLVFAAGAAGGEPPEGAETYAALSESGPPIERIIEADENATAVIMYTSGTTGNAKGAELTHANLVANATFSARALHGQDQPRQHPIGPPRVAIAALPLYHSFGQTVVQNATLLVGGAVSYLPRFTPEAAAQIIARDNVTLLAGVPTMYLGLLSCADVTPNLLTSLDCCVSGGAALPVAAKEPFYRKFGKRIREAYGLTETSPAASVQRAEDAVKAGTIGKPIEGVEFQIVDSGTGAPVPPGQRGELCIRGHNVMKGYYRNAQATAAALRGGWFHSGDVAYVDKDGDYYIVGRIKEMILRGGFNVYPSEVEEVLCAHPAVQDAAVIGVPHETLGEEVKAFVGVMPDAQVTQAELIEYCRQHLAAYKYPRLLQILKELPKGPTGKILKRDLR